MYAQLTLDVGPKKVAEMAHRLGVRSPLTTKEGAYVPSLGLGAIPVSPLDLASAYATLAAGGIYSKPMAIRKVLLGNGKEDTDAGWGEPSPLVTSGVLLAIAVGIGSQYLPARLPRVVMARFSRLPVLAQATVLALALMVTSVLGPEGVAPFIYFQF